MKKENKSVRPVDVIRRMNPGRHIPTGAALARSLKADQKKKFIRALAEILTGNQMTKRVMLEAYERSFSPPAVSLIAEWGDLRAASPLTGFPSVDEAEKQLTAFLK